jgi:hypothetical protein
LTIRSSVIPPFAAQPDRLGHVLLFDLVDTGQIGDGSRNPTHTVGSSGREQGIVDSRCDQLSRGGRLQKGGRRSEKAIHLSTGVLGDTSLLHPIGNRDALLSRLPLVLVCLNPAHVDDQVESVEKRARDS